MVPEQTTCGLEKMIEEIGNETKKSKLIVCLNNSKRMRIPIRKHSEKR